MHESLSDPLGFAVPGVVPGGMFCKQGRHARIPVSEPAGGFLFSLILDIKTPAGRADKGTGSAIDAGKGNVIPEWGFMKFQDGFIF